MNSDQEHSTTDNSSLAQLNAKLRSVDTLGRKKVAEILDLCEQVAGGQLANSYNNNETLVIDCIFQHIQLFAAAARSTSSSTTTTTGKKKQLLRCWYVLDGLIKRGGGAESAYCQIARKSIVKMATEYMPWGNEQTEMKEYHKLLESWKGIFPKEILEEILKTGEETSSNSHRVIEGKKQKCKDDVNENDVESRSSSSRSAEKEGLAGDDPALHQSPLLSSSQKAASEMLADMIPETLSAGNSFDSSLLDTHPLTFSFAAAGWLQMYHFGVGKALQVVGLADSPSVRLCGTSAGSIAAAGLALGEDFDNLRQYALDASIDCRSKFWNAFSLREYVLKGVDIFAVKRLAENPHLKDELNSRLEVYATRLPHIKMKKFSNCFDTPEDLGEALAASCCLTPLAGFPFQLRKTGEWVCDGGLTAFQPRGSEPNVVSINALYPFPRAHIKPTCFVPIWWGLYPPNEEAYSQVYDIGFNDAINFLVKSNKIDVIHLGKLRTIKALKNPSEDPKKAGFFKSLIHLVKDASVVFLFLCIIRPFAMVFIYVEIVLWAILCFWLAFFHEVKHLFWLIAITFLDLFWPGKLLGRKHRWANRKKGNRKWRDVYRSARNLVSFRTWAYLNFLGDHVPINNSRLEHSSRLYRVLRPMVYDGDQAK